MIERGVYLSINQWLIGIIFVVLSCNQVTIAIIQLT